MNEIAQVLAISTLGGACFGMPVSLVSERERGVWRRYRLAPVSPLVLLISTMLARYVIVLSSALLQIGIAMGYYGMPLPKNPVELFLAFSLVSFAFMGLGLVIAMLAKTAGAVQALGQMIFLPMIIIGGVGVPLGRLPEWARHVAAFLPGRYAVEAMHACVVKTEGLELVGFQLIALTVIGAAACLAGWKMFRWEPDQRLPRSAKWWVLLAVGVWALVGLAAEYFKKV